MYLQTSQDILNITKAVAVFGLTFFVCWAIYYFVLILRNGYHIVKEMRDRLHKVDEILKTLKEKIEHTTSYLLLISEGIKKLVEIVRDRSEKKRTSKQDEDDD